MERLRAVLIVMVVALARPVAAAPSAAPQIPSSVVLVYHQGNVFKPLFLRGSDGRVFELSLDGFGSTADLTLFRPGHKPSAINLLWPPGHMHGMQQMELLCDSDTAVYPPVRNIPVRTYPYVLHVEIMKAKCNDDDAFVDLEIKAELRRTRSS
jgi:hypothetical protein